MPSNRRSRTPPGPKMRFVCRVVLFAVLIPASVASWQSAAALTNQVVLFTGFLAGANSGMDFLNAELAMGIPDYLGQVFEWDEQQEAFNWVDQHTGDRSTLVLIGHSFGGSSTLQLAGDYLNPIGVDVDLTVQIDPVQNLDFGGTPNDVLPTNVDVGFNYYQISTGGFLEPQGEDFVEGATNINTEVLFNDTSITHTSIDNDPRLFALIAQNILDNLNSTSADFDLDGDVDGRDFLVWQRGGSQTPLSPADLSLWQQQYGNAEINVGTTAVPEPAGFTILLVLGVIIVPGYRLSRHRQ